MQVTLSRGAHLPTEAEATDHCITALLQGPCSGPTAIQFPSSCGVINSFCLSASVRTCLSMCLPAFVCIHICVFVRVSVCNCFCLLQSVFTSVFLLLCFAYVSVCLYACLCHRVGN